MCGICHWSVLGAEVYTRQNHRRFRSHTINLPYNNSLKNAGSEDIVDREVTKGSKKHGESVCDSKSSLEKSLLAGPDKIRSKHTAALSGA